MMIVSKYDIGDTVRIGPHDSARVVRITVGAALTYTVVYWIDGHPAEYVAYDWELELIRSVHEVD